MSRLPVEKILVVDGDSITLFALGEVLQQRGYIVDRVFTPAEALEKLTHDSFDVILFDERKQGISIKEFSPRLREMDSHVEIIVITAGVSNNAALEALRNGVCE